MPKRVSVFAVAVHATTFLLGVSATLCYFHFSRPSNEFFSLTLGDVLKICSVVVMGTLVAHHIAIRNLHASKSAEILLEILKRTQDRLEKVYNASTDYMAKPVHEKHSEVVVAYKAWSQSITQLEKCSQKYYPHANDDFLNEHRRYFYSLKSMVTDPHFENANGTFSSEQIQTYESQFNDALLQLILFKLDLFAG